MGNNNQGRSSLRLSNINTRAIVVAPIDPGVYLQTTTPDFVKAGTESQQPYIALTQDRCITLGEGDDNFCWSDNPDNINLRSGRNQLTFRLNNGSTLPPQLHFDSLPNIHSLGLWRAKIEEKNQPKWRKLAPGTVFKMGSQVLKTLQIDPSSSESFAYSMTTVFNDIFHMDTTALSFHAFGPNFFEYNGALNRLQISRSMISAQFSLNSHMCRICMETESQASPFAHNICRCSDSMPIHVKCLLSSVAARCHRTEYRGMVFYSLMGLKCEICKNIYRKTVTVNGKVVPIVVFDFPRRKPVTVFEVYHVGSKDVKNLVFWPKSNTSANPIGMGRDEGNHLRFKELSVEGRHGLLRWKNSTPEISFCNFNRPVFFRVSNPLFVSELEGDLLEHSGKLFRVKVMSSGELSYITQKTNWTLIKNPLTEPMAIHRSPSSQIDLAEGQKATLSTEGNTPVMSRENLSGGQSHPKQFENLEESLIFPANGDNSVGLEALLGEIEPAMSRAPQSETPQITHPPMGLPLNLTKTTVLPQNAFAKGLNSVVAPTPKTNNVFFDFRLSARRISTETLASPIAAPPRKEIALSSPSDHPQSYSPHHPITIRNEPWFEDSHDWSISNLEIEDDEPFQAKQCAFKFN